MGIFWERFEKTGKVTDYLDYCREEKNVSYGIQYCFDRDGTFGDPGWRAGQENNHIDQGAGEDYSVC
jgi:hypothetical protein